MPPPQENVLLAQVSDFNQFQDMDLESSIPKRFFALEHAPHENEGITRTHQTDRGGSGKTWGGSLRP